VASAANGGVGQLGLGERQAPFGDEPRCEPGGRRRVALRFPIQQDEQDRERVAQLDGLGELVRGREHDAGLPVCNAR
jgi:hypothetical protein